MMFIRVNNAIYNLAQIQFIQILGDIVYLYYRGENGTTHLSGDDAKEFLRQLERFIA
jgi:hypothetical protein